jgi:PadR family transcriptional regulator PadR
MIRNLELAFIKLHILYHADIEEIYGVGLMGELGHHGYTIGPGTLYPILAKMEKGGLLSC